MKVFHKIYIGIISIWKIIFAKIFSSSIFIISDNIAPNNIPPNIEITTIPKYSHPINMYLCRF